MGRSFANAIVRRLIAEKRETIRNFASFDEEHEVYSATETAVWDYEWKRPYKKDVLKEDRLSHVKKHMQDAKLFHKYTLQGMLDELDVIESLEVPGKDPIFGEVLERQAKIYEAMGVEAPKSASLCVAGI